MPKEHRKRGRRGDKKRKQDDVENQLAVKRAKTADEEAADEVEIIVGSQQRENSLPYEDNFVPLGGEANPVNETPFYGLLDEQEQEYFKQADSILELNQFGDDGERSVFVENVFREAQGKELKIANSQSCSRLMEKLIAISSSTQLKSLWAKFKGHFIPLFQHRFASHCCESLFRHSVPFVREELLESTTEPGNNRGPAEDDSTMESLFLSCTNEVQGNLGFLITDRYASHPLRILLIILAGKSSSMIDNVSLLQSRKKEHNAGVNVENIVNTSNATSHPSSNLVPESFFHAAETLASEMTNALDETSLRALCTHPIANPVLQLLLIISLTSSHGKQHVAKDSNSLFRKLLPDQIPSEGTDSAIFVNHMTYDSIGSRLIEVLVTYAPGKTFKTLYKSIFKERLPSMARNDIASYPAIKVLERLGKDDLEPMVHDLCQELPNLVKRSKHGFLKSLIEKVRLREISERPIADTLRSVYGDEDAVRLDRMLDLSDLTERESSRKTPVDGSAQDQTGRKPEPLFKQSAAGAVTIQQTHASLLCQTMLRELGPLRALITDCLLALPLPKLLNYSKFRPTSQIIQTAFLEPQQQAPMFRRQLIPRFCRDTTNITSSEENTGSVLGNLATDSIGSHVLDAIWTAIGPSTSPSGNATTISSTSNLSFLCERLAADLLAVEARMKDTQPGRAVWRNWKMDVYKYSGRAAWLRAAGMVSDPRSRGSDSMNAVGGRQPAATAASQDAETGKGKTALELARERYATNAKVKRERQQRIHDRQQRKGGHGRSFAKTGSSRVDRPDTTALTESVAA